MVLNDDMTTNHTDRHAAASEGPALDYFAAESDRVAEAAEVAAAIKFGWADRIIEL